MLHFDRGNLTGRTSDVGYLDDSLEHKHDCEKREASGALNGRLNLAIDAIMKEEVERNLGSLGKKCH